MVRTKKIFREDLLNGAYDFVLAEGFKKFRARRVADFIKCSTQPIYHEFTDLKAYKSATQSHITAEISKDLALNQVGSLDELADNVSTYAKEKPKEFYRFFLADSTCKEMVRAQVKETYHDLACEKKATVFNEFEPFWYYSLGQAADQTQLENI